MKLTFVLLILLFSCAGKSVNEEPTKLVRMKGFGDDSDSLSLDPNSILELDSVRYSFGQTNYILRRSLRLGESFIDYTVLFDKNPFWHKDFTIVENFHPLRLKDSTTMTCSFELIDESYYEISWKSEGKEIFVRDTVYLGD